MKPEDLQDGGVYRLSRDVPNPAPDRRYRRHWTAQPIWQTGLTVVVSIYPETDRRDHTIRLDTGGHYDSMGPGTEGFEAFIDALEPAARTFETVMFSINRWRGYDLAESLLEELTRMGRISLDDIEAADAHRKQRQKEEDTKPDVTDSASAETVL